MKWYSKLTIGTKIWILSGFMIVSLLGTGLFSKSLVNNLGERIGEITQVHLPAVRAQMTADMMHDGLTGVVYRAVVAGDDSNQEELTAVEADLKDVSETFSKTIAEIEGYAISDESRKNLEEVKPALKAYTDQASTIVSLVKSGKISEAKTKLPEFQKAFGDLEETLGGFGDKIQEGATHVGQEAIDFKNKATRAGDLVMIVSGLLAFLMAWYLARDILARLKLAISGLKNEALQVSEASVNAKKDAESLSSSSTEQSTAIQETAASLEEINAMLKRTSENAKNLNNSSKESSDSANEGNRSVHEVLEAMQTI